MTQPEEKINPLPIVQALVRQGVSARQALVAARAEGVKMRDATWFQIYAKERNNLTLQIGAAAEPLIGIPHHSQIGELRTKVATGYLQYASVYVRDRQTGIVATRPFAVRSLTLQPRETVIAKALSAFQAQAHPSGNYGGEQVLGATYGSTLQLFPQLPGEEL